MSINKDKLDQLDKCLSRVIDLLKFAEAKNGMVLSVGIAVLFGVGKVIGGLENINQYLVVYLFSFSSLIVVSILLALLSFIPRLTPPIWMNMAKKDENDNPLFFGHACKYCKKSYLELFNKKYPNTGIQDDVYELELCNLIVNNSKIAFIKFEFFVYAIWSFIGAVFTPLGAILIWMLREYTTNGRFLGFTLGENSVKRAGD